jgi:hypothetical protein
MNHSYECMNVVIGTRKEMLPDIRRMMIYEYIVKTKATLSEYNIPIAYFIDSYTRLINWTIYLTSIRNEISTAVFRA